MMVSGKWALDNWQRKERFFFASLDNFCAQMGIVPVSVPACPYPMNIFHAFRQVCEQIGNDNRDEPICIVEAEGYPYCIATAATWDTGMNLYYLPLNQLHDLLISGRSDGQLLLSVYAYLRQVAGIPSYVNDSHISGVYDMLRDDLSSDYGWEGQDYLHARSVLNAAYYFGKKLDKRISHPYHLQQWGSRLGRYIPGTPPQEHFRQIVQRLYHLYETYPDRRFDDQIFPGLLLPQSENRMYPDGYVSFVWDCEGWLGDQVFTYTNEWGMDQDIIEEPLLFRLFDVPGGRTADNLRFELDFFELLDELAYAINQLQHESKPTF